MSAAELLFQTTSTSPTSPFDFRAGLVNTTEGTEAHYEESKRNYIYSIAFICLALHAGVICREWLKRLYFPYTALLFLFGCLLGVLDYNFAGFRVMTDFARFDSRLIMHLFLPAIIYESAYSLEPHMFLMAWKQCGWLAVPGLFICTSLTAVFAKYILESYKWDWSICFLFGTILSATDVMTVEVLLKDCGISPSLTSIIEGESLLNNGHAIILFHSLVRSFEKGTFNDRIIYGYYARDCAISMTLAYLISTGTIALLRRIELDTDIEVTFTLCIAYLTYYTCEITLEVSGVLAVVVLGMSVSAYKSSIDDEEDNTIHEFWETLSFWANTLIFTIVGIIITSKNLPDFGFTDVGLVISTYVAVTAFRAVMVAVLRPLLNSSGYGFSWNYGAVVVWGGLRGAVGLALVLLAQHSVPHKTGNQLLVQVSGIIFLTLIFNAPTMKIVLRLLGVGKVTAKNMKDMTHAVNLLRDVVNMTEKATRMDKHMTGVDWMWVRSVTHIKHPYEKEKDVYTEVYSTFDIEEIHCPKCKTNIEIPPSEEEARGIEEDSRRRILRVFESSVWNQHIRLGISRRTLRHLYISVENALDKPGKYVQAEDIRQEFLIVGKFAQSMRRVMTQVMDKLCIPSRQDLKNLHQELSGFRKWCLNKFTSRQWGVIIFWVMLLNVVPISKEIINLFLEEQHNNSMKDFETEFIAFEALNGILTPFYVFDSCVGIGALGWLNYLHYHVYKMDFLVAIVAVAQAILGIVVISIYPTTYLYLIIYILVSMGSFRLLRLLWVIISGIAASLMDAACSVIFNAYDFAVGFIVANEKIAKTSAKILEYEPSADVAQFTSENNIAQVLSHMNDMDSDFPDVTNAWRTQRATVCVLRDMKNTVKSMFDVYMLDETDAEILLEELALRLKDTLCAPTHIPAKTGVRDLMKNVPWIKSKEMLDLIMGNSSHSSFSVDDTVQESGSPHPDVKIITSGIVQISGTNDGSQETSLPNTDSLYYFTKPGSFCEYAIAPETLGILGYLLRSNSVTSTTCIKETQLMSVSYRTLEEAENQFGDLSFVMWRPIALQIAFDVLEEQEVYEYWTEERIKVHLEEGIFPDLRGLSSFEVHDAITDMVLIQGRILDSETDLLYTGPCYIPSTIRKMGLTDNPKTRPRIVMILLREEKYHSQTIMGWIKPKDISYKGLCFVHGIRRASLYGVEQLTQTLGARRSSFFQTLGQIFSKTTDGKILQSDAP